MITHVHESALPTSTTNFFVAQTIWSLTPNLLFFGAIAHSCPLPFTTWSLFSVLQAK